MKKIISTAAALIAFASPHYCNGQTYLGGIAVKVENKTIFEHPSMIKDAADAVWRSQKARIHTKMCDSLGRAIHQRTGQTVTNLNLRLGATPEMELARDGASIIITYRVRGNTVDFKVTTPTIFGSYADPAFSLAWDMAIVISFDRPTELRYLRPTRATGTVELSKLYSQNVPGDLVVGVNDAIKFFGGDGFIPDVRKIEKDLSDEIRAEIDNRLSAVRNNSKLLEEMGIDGSQAISCTAGNGGSLLEINHPYSEAGRQSRKMAKVITRTTAPRIRVPKAGAATTKAEHVQLNPQPLPPKKPASYKKTGNVFAK